MELSPEKLNVELAGQKYKLIIVLLILIVDLLGTSVSPRRQLYESVCSIQGLYQQEITPYIL